MQQIVVLPPHIAALTHRPLLALAVLSKSVDFEILLWRPECRDDGGVTVSNTFHLLRVRGRGGGLTDRELEGADGMGIQILIQIRRATTTAA